jgi:hypothetical protein
MECERSDSPLRQGDVIAAHPRTPAWQNPWTRMGILLTADCDIDKGKGGPDLVYLPVISHRTYLADVWLSEEALSLAAKARISLNKQLGTLDAKLMDRHIDAWGAAGGIEKITQELAGRVQNKVDGAVSPKLNEKIGRLWQASKGLDKLSHKPQPTQADQLERLIRELVEYKCAIDASAATIETLGKAAVKAALETVQARLDMWLITDLIGLDPEMVQNTDFGFIVPLRSFSLIPISQIEVDKAKWFEAPDKYLRICRLRGIYKTDLLQQFANMFVRVGLEDRRDEHHRFLFQRCADSLFPGASK